MIPGRLECVRLVLVSQGVVNQVDKNMDVRRLLLACHNQASAAMFLQITRYGRDPARMGRELLGPAGRRALDLQDMRNLCATEATSRAATAIRWSAMVPVRDGVHSAT